MSPLVAAATVAAMTTLGRWARGKGLTIDTVVGLVGVALGLAIIEQANVKLSRGLGALVVIGVATAHLPTLLDSTGLTGVTRNIRPGTGLPGPTSPRSVTGPAG
jgi:hypothetical protein